MPTTSKESIQAGHVRESKAVIVIEELYGNLPFFRSAQRRVRAYGVPRAVAIQGPK